MQVWSLPETVVRLTLLTLVFTLAGQASKGETAAPAGARIYKADGGRLERIVRSFAEVEIVLSDQTTLWDISALPRAPGSDVEVTDGGQSVIVQLPAGEVAALIEAGAEVKVVRSFVLVEGSPGDATRNGDGGVGPLAVCSGAYVERANDQNVTIPDDKYPVEWVVSPIFISSAPVEALVTCVDVHYKIVHDYAAGLIVDMTNQDGSREYRLRYLVSGGHTIEETISGIMEFQGEPVNQGWGLWVLDIVPFDSGEGHIDSWWIRLYYGPEGYCPAWSSCGYEYISNVQVGGINNSTGCSGYADYTGISTEMRIGASYDITVTNGGPVASDECGIWVDWNQDLDFDDAGEAISVAGSPGKGPYTATITPPSEAKLGKTRMRIRVLDSYYGTLEACGDISWGEAEDYGINVTESIGYCAASGGCVEHISKVVVGEISKESDCDGYADYTSLSTTMGIGTGYAIEVTNGEPYGEEDQCGIWADWNQDQDFDDAGETILVAGSPGAGPYTATITPPADAKAGETRMRIRVNWSGSGSAEPCGDTDYGEVEDYTVNVGGGPQTLKVSGHVTLSNGAALSGVLLEAYNLPSTPTGLTDITDANGYYEIVLASPWSGYVEASRENYGFSWHTVFTDVTTDQVQDFSAYYAYSGGLGMAGSPYLISTPADMNAIGSHPEDWDKYFKLIADINLADYTGTQFKIVGNETTPFGGVFDGNDHEISNFTYSFAGRDDVGVFGYVDGGEAEIKNVSLKEPRVDADHSTDVGALVGHLERGQVSGSHVSGGLISHVDPVSMVGGLVGNNNATIRDCSSSCSVSGEDTVGGLVGYNQGTISKSCASGTVSGNNAGGLAGISEGIVSESYSTTDVSGTATLGGLVGANWGGAISSCYASGDVSGTVNVGGLVGSHADGTVSRSYSSGAVSGATYVGGLVGYEHDFSGSYAKCFWDNTVNPSLAGIGNASDPDVIGKSTADMQKESTFVDAGWDFTTPVWKMVCECGNYPKLWWEVVKYGGGSGTAEEPFLICTAQQMNAVGAEPNDWHKHFKLVADINLSAYTGMEFNIIGTYSLNPFSGVFDGNNHKISNFSYESSEGSNIGLFGYVSGENAEIKNLGLIEPNIHVEEAGYYVGSLVGCLGDGIISGCYARGGSVSGRECIGGLVGDMRKASASTVAYCYSSAVVSGTYRDVGGLMGRNNQGSVSRCYCTGSVSGGDYVGGLVGRNNEGIVSECYSSSSVSGGYCVGGLVAINHFDGFGTPGVVTNCYATGSVWAGDYAAGLVANNYCSRISNCYSIGYVSGDGVGGGLVATTGGCLSAKCIASFWDKQTSKFPFGYQGIPKTTVDMQTRSTFTGAGWDFGSVWDMCDGMNYPRLAWQVRPVGDIACPDGVEMNDLGALVEQWLRPVLASDVAPEGGDGMVNFVDWVFFANEWQTGQDIAELAVFADQWLQSSAYCADIAPEGGDGIVNMLDICAFADHWLEGE